MAETCSCESESHSELGPVADHERVGRLVTSPRHRKGNGQLRPGVFPLSHIRESGLSLMRVDKMTEELITKVSTAIACLSEGQTPEGLLVRLAADVRKIKDKNNIRGVCLVDDPVFGEEGVPDNPAHAIAITALPRSDEEAVAIQQELFEIFKDQLKPLGALHSL